MSSFQATSSVPFAGADLARPWIDPRLPSLTMAALFEAHHKNAAALGSANQAVFDGLKTLLQRQGFLLTASVDACARVTSDLLAAGSFEERAAKQADATRDGYVSIVARFRELSGIVVEANVTAIDIVNARIIEGFGELKALFAPSAPTTAPIGELPAPSLAEPTTAVEEVAALEVPAEDGAATVPVAPDVEPSATASTAAPETAAPEEAVVAPSTTPEAVAAEPEVAAAPAPSPKTAAKPAVRPARSAAPKVPPPKPPRRPATR